MIFTNTEYEMKSEVVELKDGRFSVTMVDLESGNRLPVARIYDKKELAIEYAKLIVGGNVDRIWETA